jgi:hypothetical protein
VNFQVTVLKILAGYPDGFALIADLKRDMAILAASGRDWGDRTKRLAARLPHLDIFSQRLVERVNGGWRITDKGRDALALMEAPPSAAGLPGEGPGLQQRAVPESLPRLRVEEWRRRRERLMRRRAARARVRRISPETA